MSEIVVGLRDLKDPHRPLVGGKAWSLGTLAGAGFNVPEGFVLTTEASARFLEPFEGELKKVADQVAGGGLKLDESWAFLGELRAKIVQSPLPPDVRQALEEACRPLGDTPVAVRSSGTKEDLEGSSFAGQYETFLNVKGFSEIEAAVKRCWASVWRSRVLLYAARKAGGVRDLGMAVVVQKLVAGEVAGVLFTVDPISGREQEAVIESCFGLGEALVSGKVNADRFVVNTVTGAVVSTAIADKRLEIVAQGKGTVERELGERAKKPTLETSHLEELGELAGAIQEHYGRPMDVEWVLSQGVIHVVQARPITKISFAPDTGEWTTADFRDGGVSSDVCSPFMWSLYESILETTLPQYFIDIKLMASSHRAKWSRMFFARPYWNLGEVKTVLEQIPGYSERAFDEGLGVRITYDGEGKRTPTTIMGILKALPVLFALKRHYREQLERDKAFVAAFEEKKKPYDLPDAALAALDAKTFATRFRELVTRLYFETESTYFYTIYNTTNAKQDFRPVLEKAEKACHGTLDTLMLVGGLRNLSHLRPIREMHAILEKTKRVDDQTVREFAQKWRHHSSKELDIRVPRWKDDHAFVRSMMEQALAAFDPSREPEKQAQAQHERYLVEREKAKKALRWSPFARSSFLGTLDLVRDYAWWREEMRDHSTYAYHLVRIWAVEAARRLVAAKVLEQEDDVWYMTFQETLGVVEGSITDARARVRAGRRMVRSFRNFQNPGEIGQRHTSGASQAPVAEGTLRGIGCSPGRVEGRAKVVRQLEESKKVEKGDILVTTFTDPAWTPLLGRVAGVVTETGGVLSHAAVISREYGIPAVLAVPGAVQAIKDGDMLVVDGGAGTVEIKK